MLLGWLSLGAVFQLSQSWLPRLYAVPLFPGNLRFWGTAWVIKSKRKQILFPPNSMPCLFSSLSRTLPLKPGWVMVMLVCCVGVPCPRSHQGMG